MKKFIAVLMCMVMCLTMIPSFFASASVLPADGQAEVVAQNDESGSDLLSALKGFVDLWGGLFNLIIGSDVAKNFLPALKDVLKLVSIGDFFSVVGRIWKDVVGK
ncbi:hypothetical protein IKP13_10270 [bacterium]|nr:hypothetical protein [bacterium]